MATSTSRVPVAKTYKIYIDGKFPRTESGRYFPLKGDDGEIIANICRGSRKDFRNSVVAARKAFGGWSAASAYLRGQILYRIAEMLEGRQEQFVTELVSQGVGKRSAKKEVEAGGAIKEHAPVVSPQNEPPEARKTHSDTQKDTACPPTNSRRRIAGLRRKLKPQESWSKPTDTCPPNVFLRERATV